MDKEFIRIYNLYKNDVLHLALSYTKKISDAEDVAQNVFIKLYKNLSNLKDEVHIKKWCMIVTINECKNLYLSFWKRNIFSINEQDDIKMCFFNDETYILKDALFKLPKRERIILYLYYYEGYKVKEIADILKLNPSTIQTKLSRTREKLKNILEGEYDNGK